MKGINHKQAVRLIHLRLDGLLKESQSFSLNAHLESCDSCRAYAAEMDALAGHLQNEFQAHWDRNIEPSHRVAEYVTTKARRILMTNRISSVFRLMASVSFVAVLLLGINFMISQMKIYSIDAIGTQSVSGSELSDNRLIAFTSDQGGNAEIYTMYSDGSNLTNITNYSAQDVNPIWSPDGRRIVFESDRTGFVQIYTMNPDGSNLTQITNQEADHAIGTQYGNTPELWSPDGHKIIFSQTVRGDANNRLYVMNEDGSNKIALTGEPGLYTFLGWSPDGQKVVYQISNANNNGDNRIVVASADGTSTFDGPHFEGDEGRNHHQIYWETSEQFITLSSNSQRPTWGLWNLTRFYTTEDAYLNYVGSNPILVTSDSPVVAIIDRTYVVENQDTLSWFVHSGAPIPFSPWSFSDLCKTPTDPLVAETSHTISPDKLQDFVSLICPEGTTYFFLMNSDGTEIQQLDSSIPGQSQVTAVTWSPDGKHVIVTTSADSNTNSTNLFRFDVQAMLNDPSVKPIPLTTDDAWKYGVAWQPIVSNEVVVNESTSEPTQTSASDNLIVFAANSNESANVNMDIYSVDRDGGNLTNLTQHPAQDSTPVWSPDGERIAFMSNRDGNNNLYVMNADGSGLVRLSTDDVVLSTVPVWSPDSQKIAYRVAGLSNGSANIAIVDSDGQNHRILTSYAAKQAAWSAVWSLDGKFLFFDFGQGIVKVDVDSGNAEPLTTVTDVNPLADLALSQDGTQLLYLTSACNSISQSSSGLCYNVKTTHIDGTSEETLETVNPSEICPVKQTTTWMGSSTKWSPDRTKILLLFTCEDDGWIYIANADGSGFKPLTNYPILGNGSENVIATADWSPDSALIVFMSALNRSESENLYILNVNDALQNPALLPSPLNISLSQIADPKWKPAP